MNADGSGLVNLTNSLITDMQPSWSPDGCALVFTSDVERYSDIFIMNADGSGKTRLTFHFAGDFSPTWSP